eukprot:TRINITY_DN1983_c0_g1_i1.p1 TRINITY_DN1983_c0_g1~~TRINITY_DN1983_c0_g1_i1.p1  ORF type:complete len:476 (+),score=124.21 TRINITY_DN1983_c0_g1_i1:34-1428(+)
MSGISDYLLFERFSVHPDGYFHQMKKFIAVDLSSYIDRDLKFFAYKIFSNNSLITVGKEEDKEYALPPFNLVDEKKRFFLTPQLVWYGYPFVVDYSNTESITINKPFFQHQCPFFVQNADHISNNDSSVPLIRCYLHGYSSSSLTDVHLNTRFMFVDELDSNSNLHYTVWIFFQEFSAASNSFINNESLTVIETGDLSCLQFFSLNPKFLHLTINYNLGVILEYKDTIIGLTVDFIDGEGLLTGDISFSSLKFLSILINDNFQDQEDVQSFILNQPLLKMLILTVEGCKLNKDYFNRISVTNLVIKLKNVDEITIENDFVQSLIIIVSEAHSKITLKCSKLLNLEIKPLVTPSIYCVQTINISTKSQIRRLLISSLIFQVEEFEILDYDRDEENPECSPFDKMLIQDSRFSWEEFHQRHDVTSYQNVVQANVVFLCKNQIFSFNRRLKFKGNNALGKWKELEKL